MVLDPYDDAERGLERLSTEWQKPEIILDNWIEYENQYGESSLIPENVFELDLTDIKPGKSITITRYVNQWGARLSASGYMDCTDWLGPYDTHEQAAQDLVEYYADEDDEGVDNA